MFVGFFVRLFRATAGLVGRSLSFLRPLRPRVVELGTNPMAAPFLETSKVYSQREHYEFEVAAFGELDSFKIEVFEPERRAYELFSATVSSPKGYVFLGDHVVRESNYRSGDVQDGVALDRIWNFAESLRKPKVGRKEPLTADPSPKYLVRWQYGNYYHWLLEEIPRILFAVSWKPDVTLLLDPSTLPGFANDFLKDLDVKKIEIPQGLIDVENLMVMDSRPSHIPDRESILRLRNFCQGSISRGKANQNTRLYLSRRGTVREMEGEVELENWLLDRGFLILMSSDLRDIERNAELFSSASLVVGSHGAGLANTVFCQPGTSVIELTTMYFWNSLFASLGHNLGLDHQLGVLPFFDTTPMGKASDARKILLHKL